MALIRYYFSENEINVRLCESNRGMIFLMFLKFCILYKNTFTVVFPLLRRLEDGGGEEETTENCLHGLTDQGAGAGIREKQVPFG